MDKAAKKWETGIKVVEFANTTMTIKCDFKNKEVIAGLMALFFILLVLFSGWLGVDILNKIKEGRNMEAVNTITVSATGEVWARPDLALTTFSVVSESKTVAEAVSENSGKMNAVIDFLKAEGVEEKDLKTTSFAIYPRYEWRKDAGCYPSCPSGERILVGYEVWQSLEVKVRDLGKVGSLIQGATDRGSNQVGQLQFTIDNQDEFKNQARGEAIEEAKAKAKTLASQLGVSLGKIVSFNESAVFPYYYGLERAMGGAVEEAVLQPQVEPGENKIEVSVTLIYQID